MRVAQRAGTDGEPACPMGSPHDISVEFGLPLGRWCETLDNTWLLPAPDECLNDTWEPPKR